MIHMQSMYAEFAYGSLKHVMCKKRLWKLDLFTLKKPERTGSYWCLRSLMVGCRGGGA